MSNRRDDISLIRKYLNGELDTRAMHRLERTAQDDPFLMDALDGYHIRTDQQANLEDLANKLHSRVHRFQRKTLVLWPLIGAVASVLGFIIVGAWWIMIYLPAANKRANTMADHTAAVVRPSNVDPGPLEPGARSLSGTIIDTVRKDTTVKKPVDTNKLAVTRQPPRKHDPVKGSVEASTVIADLNRQPYSIAKHKADLANAQKNATDQPAVLKPNQAAKGADPVVNTANNNNSVASAIKPLTPTSKPPTVASNVNAGKALPGKLPATPGKATVPNVSLNNNVVATQSKIAPSPIVKAPDLARTAGSLKTKADTQKNNALSEVVVVGYATQRKKDIAASRADIKPLTINPNTSFNSTRVDPNVAIKSNELPTINGQVVGSDDGLPIGGVALRIMGTQTGTVTDANGKFSIRMAKNQALQANYVGYMGKQVVPAGTNLKIVLQPMSNALNEIVITGAEKKKDKNNITDNKNDAIANVSDAASLTDTKTTGSKTVAPKINTNPVMHVNGRVLAFSTNLPIPAIVMWNKNADVQYRLENDGIFDIVVHRGDEIYVGHTGFKTQKVKIKNSLHFDIVLEENNSTLFDGFVKGLTFTPYDDTAHPSMGWDKFKLLQNIRSADGKTGTVKVDFTINANNTVSNIKVTKSVSALADSAAVRIIREQTKWVHNTNDQPENVSVKFKVQ